MASRVGKAVAKCGTLQTVRSSQRRLRAIAPLDASDDIVEPAD